MEKYHIMFVKASNNIMMEHLNLAQNDAPNGSLGPDDDETYACIENSRFCILLGWEISMFMVN